VVYPERGNLIFAVKLLKGYSFSFWRVTFYVKPFFSIPSYSQEESRYLFQVLHLLVERLLKKGISLIIDATNLSERYREHFYNITDRLGVKLILVRVEAPPEVIYKRLDDRKANRESNSDADWSVYKQMKSSIDKIKRKHYAVDTSWDITPVLDKIVREVKRSAVTV